MRIVDKCGCLNLVVVGVQAVITGQKNCNQYMCVTGLHDNSTKTETYTLGPPDGKAIPLSTFGWIAIGFGSNMANTPMVIGWPNSDGSFTLSQRQAGSNVMPTGECYDQLYLQSLSCLSLVVSKPPRIASLQKPLSFSNSSTTSFSFTLPATTTTSTLNATKLIWAYSTTNPKSSAVDATIVQHLASGEMTIALLAPYHNTTSTSASSSGSTDTISNRKMLVAHVVCGALATMCFLPIGVLVPRFARGLTTASWWFALHSVINGIIAFGLILAAFGIAVSSFDGGINSTHRKCGLALFIFTLFQVALGIFTHWYKSTAYSLHMKSGRGPSNFLHMALGLVLVILGWTTAWEGLAVEWGKYSGTGNLSVGWKVGWGLIVALVSIAYIAGLILFVPRQRALEQTRRESGAALLDDSSNQRRKESTASLPPPPSVPPRPSASSAVGGTRRLPPRLPDRREYELARRP